MPLNKVGNSSALKRALSGALGGASNALTLQALLAGTGEAGIPGEEEIAGPGAVNPLSGIGALPQVTGQPPDAGQIPDLDGTGQGLTIGQPGFDESGSLQEMIRKLIASLGRGNIGG